MSLPFGHHVLHNRYCFTGTIKLETPLRLSSGHAADDTDAPLMRNRAGIPYIPGSSLRGALRSEVERIVAAAGEGAGLRSCTLFTTDKSDGACLSVNPDKQQKTSENRDEEAVARYVDQHLCHVCKLFGSTVYASRLLMEDVTLTDQKAWRERTIIRDGVGIDRDTGTARQNVKFDYEVLEPGPVFTLRMQVENVSDDDKKLLTLSMSLLKQGLYVGGKRAAGLGKVALATWPMQVTGFATPQGLWNAILAGEDPHKPLA